MEASTRGELHVGVIRLQLFKLSETFIPAQVRHYTRYAPFYLGRRPFGPPPEGADVACFRPGTREALRALLLRDPRPWLAAIGSRRPSLLHAHFAIDAAAALPLARKLDLPMVTTLHAFDVTKRDSALLASRKFNEVAFVFRRRALQREGALFVCVSDFIRRQAIAAGYPEARSVTLPIGIDVARFRPVPSHEREPALIVHVARLVEKKGTYYLLEALARIRPHFPLVRLVVIGDGPLRAELQQDASRLGLGDAVRFLGPMSHAETIGWISKAAAIAVPSVTAASGDVEGLPTVIFEAGALGVPVVGTLHAGIPEAIADGTTGYLVQERDVEALADRLSRVLADPGVRSRLGESARAHMEATFDIVRQTTKLEALYDDVLSRHRKRRS